MSLPFGLTPSTIKPGAVRNMTSDKLATFSLGGTKKTPFQKHKEALEAKRKKEEEQLAAEHAQWISDFEEPSGTKRFVKGDTINHGMGGSSSGGGGGGRGPSQHPGSKPPNAALQSMFGQDDDIDGEDIDGEEIGKAAPPATSSAPPPPRARVVLEPLPPPQLVRIEARALHARCTHATHTLRAHQNLPLPVRCSRTAH